MQNREARATHNNTKEQCSPLESYEAELYDGKDRILDTKECHNNRGRVKLSTRKMQPADTENSFACWIEVFLYAELIRARTSFARALEWLHLMSKSIMLSGFVTLLETTCSSFLQYHRQK